MSEQKKEYITNEPASDAVKAEVVGGILERKIDSHSDLSPRVIRLARAIDRLSLAAKYNITLLKGETKEQRWVIEISEEKKVRDMEL